MRSESASDLEGDDAAAAAVNDNLGYLLKHVHLRFDALARPALTAIGLGGREFAVLAALAVDAPLSQHEAAQFLGIDRTTMVALVDALEAKSLVERKPAPDRRKNLVRLTPAGHDLLGRAQVVRADVERRFLSPVSDADVRELRRILRTLLASPLA
jgi:DNA-binding MarR family transcriptional regulator